MQIKDNIALKYRCKPEKYTKYEKDTDIATHLTKNKLKRLYDYYKCDFCGGEIKITKKWEERTGGLITLPDTLTKNASIVVALHNKCLKQVIKEFEEVS